MKNIQNIVLVFFFERREILDLSTLFFGILLESQQL